jgi:Protein of unknown function (DUF3892)
LIGGVNSNGKQWRISGAEAIDHIERNKYEFFAEIPQGKRVFLKIERDAEVRKYLKATNDSEHQDILLHLPKCS